MLKSLSDAEIFDAGRHYAAVGTPSTLVHTYAGADGPVPVRRPPLPHRKYVDRSGGVRMIVLSNSPAIRSTNTPYAFQKIAYLEAMGFIPYAECPLGTSVGQRNMPAAMRGRQDLCRPDEFGHGKKYGDHQACPHVEEIIALRHNDQKKADVIREEQRKSFEERRLDEETKRNDAVFGQLAKLTSVVMSGTAGSGNLLDQIADSDDMMELLIAKRAQRAKHPDKEPVPVPVRDPSAEHDPFAAPTEAPQKPRKPRT